MARSRRHAEGPGPAEIPPGTQNGRTFRLTGRGMPRFKAYGHGDLYVKAKVVLPTDLSDEARTAAAALLDPHRPSRSPR